MKTPICCHIYLVASSAILAEEAIQAAIQESIWPSSISQENKVTRGDKKVAHMWVIHLNNCHYTQHGGISLKVKNSPQTAPAASQAQKAAVYQSAV